MEQMLQSLLNLPAVRVLKSEYTERWDLVISVESTLENTTCRRCGREIHHFHGYDKPLRLRHLPIFERRVYLEIRPKRTAVRIATGSRRRPSSVTGARPTAPIRGRSNRICLWLRPIGTAPMRCASRKSSA